MESFQLLRRRTTELFSSLEQNMPAMPAIPSMPAMPSLPSVPSLGGGGSNKSNNANTMKATWEKLDIPHLPRSAHSADIVAGTVYLFGGEITPGRVVADNDVHAVKLPSSGAPADYYAIKAKAAKKPVVIPTVVEPTPETEEEELSEIPLTGAPATAMATATTPTTPRAPRTDLPDVPPPRAGHATAVIGHRIFLFGGHTNGTNGGPTVPLDEGGRVWVFDTRTHLWSFLDPQSPAPTSVEEVHPSPRSHHAAVATTKPDSFDSITSPTSPKFRSRPHASSRAEAWRDWALGTSAEAEQTYGTPQRPVVGVLAEKATDPDADGYGTFIIHGGVLAPAAVAGAKPAVTKKVEDDDEEEDEEEDSEEDEDDEDEDDSEEDDDEDDEDDSDEEDSDDSDEDEESEDEAPSKKNKGKAKAEPKPTPASTSASKPASAPAPAPVQTTAETWAFDVRSRVWQRLPDAPAPARAGVSLAIGRGKGGRLYRFGGFGSTGSNSASGNLDFLDLGVDVFDDQITGGRGSEAVLAVRGGGWKTLGVSLGPQAGFGFNTVDEEGGETQGLQQPGTTPGNNNTTNNIDWPGARSVAGFQAVSVGGGREYLVLLFGAREPSTAGTPQFWDDIWALQVPSEGFSLASITDTAFSVVRTVRSGSLSSRPGTATSTTTNISYAPSTLTTASTATSTGTTATTATNATINAADLGLTWTRVEAGPHDEEDDESAEGPGGRGWVASAAMLEENGLVVFGGLGEGGRRLGDGWVLRLG